MENAKRARFTVWLGQDIEAKIDFEVIDSVERATGIVFGSELQKGAISFNVLAQLVFFASKSVIGGLTLKSVREHIKADANRGVYIRVIQALGEFFAWYASDIDEADESGDKEMPAGEAAGTT